MSTNDTGRRGYYLLVGLLPWLVVLLLGTPRPGASQVRLGLAAEVGRSADFELGFDWGMDVSSRGLRAELLGLGLVVPVASFYTADLGIGCAGGVPICPTEERRYLLGLGVEKALHDWFSVGAWLEGGIGHIIGRDGRVVGAASMAFLATGWSVLHPRVGLRVEDYGPNELRTNAIVTLGARLVVPPE